MGNNKIRGTDHRATAFAINQDIVMHFHSPERGGIGRNERAFLQRGRRDSKGTRWLRASIGKGLKLNSFQAVQALSQFGKVNHANRFWNSKTAVDVHRRGEFRAYEGDTLFVQGKRQRDQSSDLCLLAPD